MLLDQPAPEHVGETRQLLARDALADTVRGDGDSCPAEAPAWLGLHLGPGLTQRAADWRESGGWPPAAFGASPAAVPAQPKATLRQLAGVSAMATILSPAARTLDRTGADATAGARDEPDQRSMGLRRRCRWDVASLLTHLTRPARRASPFGARLNTSGPFSLSVPRLYDWPQKRGPQPSSLRHLSRCRYPAPRFRGA